MIKSLIQNSGCANRQLHSGFFETAHSLGKTGIGCGRSGHHCAVVVEETAEEHFHLSIRRLVFLQVEGSLNHRTGA